MRAVVLLAIGAILLLAGCPQKAEPERDGERAPLKAAADTSGEGPGEAEPAAAAHGADGAPPPADTPELPAAPAGGEESESWPAGVPFYPGSTVLSSTSAAGPEGRFWNATLESPEAMPSIADFYAKAAQSAGGILEEARAPDSVHYAYVIGEGKVDVHIQSQPSKSMVQLDVTPRRDDEELHRMVSWFGIDDAPPGFPLDLLPRCPGGTIEEAMIVADEVYILRLTTQAQSAEVLGFYDEHFAAKGWTLTAGTGEMAGRHVYESGEGKVNLDVVALEDKVQVYLSFETAGFIRRRAERGSEISEVR